MTLVANKWFREDPINVGKSGMDGEENRRGRKHGEVFHDRDHHKGEGGSKGDESARSIYEGNMGTRRRRGRKGTSAPSEDSNSDIEERPISLIDGKKRQRLHQVGTLT